MEDKDKTKEQLKNELVGLKQKIADLEKSITELKKTQETAKENEERFRQLSEASFEGVAITEKGNFWRVNKAFAEMFGYKTSEIIGMNVTKLVAPEYYEDVMKKIISGYDKPYEAICVKKNGERFSVEVCGKTIHYEGRIARVTAIRDISKRKRLEEQLRALANTDELTGLNNRRGFFTLAKQQLKIADRKKRKILIISIDVDNLKEINDKFGHNEGDSALIETAKILKKSFRDADIIARIGGDEFVVLQMIDTDSSSKIIIFRLQKNLETHNMKKSHFYNLSVSFGLAKYNPESPCSINELMAQADKLMYRHKK